MKNAINEAVRQSLAGGAGDAEGKIRKLGKFCEEAGGSNVLFWARHDQNHLRCESEIERVFFAAMICHAGILEGDSGPNESYGLTTGLPIEHWCYTHCRIYDDLDIQPDLNECEMGLNYRPDFSFERAKSEGASCIGSLPLFIECDGHDFHEKTKEQVARDKKRDRKFVAAGLTIIRFSGSEIWANPLKCTWEVFALAEDRFQFAVKSFAKAG